MWYVCLYGVCVSDVYMCGIHVTIVYLTVECVCGVCVSIMYMLIAVYVDRWKPTVFWGPKDHTNTRLPQVFPNPNFLVSFSLLSMTKSDKQLSCSLYLTYF